MEVFPNAIDARNGARNNVRIYTEIRAIEAAILTAIDSGLLNVLVTGTFMTDVTTGQAYASVWLDETENRSLLEQMTLVKKHFQNMGYEITQKLNTTTNNTFKWEVLW